MRRLLFLFLACTACVGDDIQAVAAFETPTGMAVAGTARDRLFVSNTAQDTIQVLNLGDDLTEIDFVFGPATRSPLRIPAGLGPADLAATADRRWVIVLNRISESLRAIDADRLLLARDAEGVVVQQPLGPAGARPSAMAVSPAMCDTCVGRVYVTLAGAGTIVGVDVIEEEGILRFESTAVFAVGGEPGGLAVRGDGRVLFASDAASSELIRVDLETGAFERRALGGVGGPVAVSTDGTAVVVGRPAERDLVVFRDADGPGLAHNDSNPLWAPIPVCAWRCDDPEADVCANAHSADRAVCETDDGLVSVAGQEYQSIYIGEVPTHIVTLGAGAGTKSLTTACGEAPRQYAEFAAIAVLDGSVLFLGLKLTEDAPLAPELVSTSFCLSPTVAAHTVDAYNVSAEARLDEYLTECPDSPDGRFRFQCLRDTPGASGGMVISPGNTGNKQWSLVWEGTLMDRTSSTGSRPGAGVLVAVPVDGTSCTSDGQCAADTMCDVAAGRCIRTAFTDLVEKLHDRGIRPCTTVSGDACTVDTDVADIVHRGDILAVASPVVADCPATPCADSTVIDERVFERRIVRVEALGDTTHLHLDRPIASDCFRAGSVLEYRIRVGDQYAAVASGESGFERVSPGERVGPSGDVGRRRREMFGLPARDVRFDLPACERYEVDGQVACESSDDLPGDVTCVPVMDEVLARSRTLNISIEESFQMFRSGVALDLSRAPVGTAGRIPGGMIVSYVGAEDPVVFVSYAGTNGVLGMVPFDVITAFDSAKRYTLLR